MCIISTTNWEVFCRTQKLCQSREKPIPDRVFQSCHAIYFCQYDYCADEVPGCGFFIKKYGINWMRIGVSRMRIGISWLRIGVSWMRIGVSWRRKIAKIRIPVRSHWAYIKFLNWPNMATKNVFQNRLILKKITCYELVTF